MSRPRAAEVLAGGKDLAVHIIVTDLTREPLSNSRLPAFLWMELLFLVFNLLNPPDKLTSTGLHYSFIPDFLFHQRVRHR